jgi:hypothetical protein
MLNSRWLVVAATILSAVSAGAQPAAPESTPTPSPTPVADMPGHVMADSPHLSMRGFSNLDYAIHEEGKPQTFALGQFDLLISSPLSDDISLLAETAVEFEEDEQGLDVERMQIKWTPSTAFSLAAGRMHTPLGYWNQTFHHGTWFQTTERRPEMYLFEDDGGILPVHGVGVEAGGSFYKGGADLKYNVSFLNGRGASSENVVHVQDATNGKAVNVWLAADPNAIHGLEVGGSGYFDAVPADGTVRTEGMREHIFTGYAAYVQSGVELIGEVSHIDHRLADRTFGTWALYAQASLKRGRCRPYYRYDRVDVADDDPYLPHKDLAIHTLGFRVDASAWVALKGEYHLLREHGDTLNAARFQVAFTF